MTNPKESSDKPAVEHTCRCPYCQGVTSKLYPFCALCGVNLTTCSSCGQLVAQEATTCPSCGAKVA
ncbi:MAG: zinc ribbon domain-containing protein [Chloroflexi bacterium]|nr:zinc ribbon domain-containing protein [Chloroflexota bacterium]